jgi:plasmid stabilization system protein ParE
MAQVAWLADRAPSAALHAADQIDAAVQLIRDFPLAAPLVDDIHHEITVPFGRDGFVLRYRVSGDRVVIVRVFHGRQSRRPTASRS